MHEYEKKALKVALNTTATRIEKHIQKWLPAVQPDGKDEEELSKIDIVLGRMVARGWLVTDEIRGVVVYCRTQSGARAALGK